MVSLLCRLKGGSSLIINNKNLCIVTPTGSHVTLLESSKWGNIVDAAVLDDGMLFVLLKSTKMMLHAYFLDESDCSMTPRSKMTLSFGTHVVPLYGDYFAVSDYNSINVEVFEWRGDSKTVRRCYVKKGCLPCPLGNKYFSLIQYRRSILEILSLETGDSICTTNASNRKLPIVDAAAAGPYVFVLYEGLVATAFEFGEGSIKRLQDLGKLPDAGDKRHLVAAHNEEEDTFSLWIKEASKMLTLKRVISTTRGVPPFEKKCEDRHGAREGVETSQPSATLGSATTATDAPSTDDAQQDIPAVHEAEERGEEVTKGGHVSEGSLQLQLVAIGVTAAVCVLAVLIARRVL